MKSFDQFIAENNGKYVDFPGGSYAQCVDLVLQYNKECVGAPVIYGNGKDLFYNADLKFYTPVKNSPTAIPPKGAIICWGEPYGKYTYWDGSKWVTIYYGHTAIVTEANVLSFKAFSQNVPANSPAHIESFNNLYRGVIGWLIPKQPSPPLTDAEKLKKIKDLANTSVNPSDFLNFVRSLLNT